MARIEALRRRERWRVRLAGLGCLVLPGSAGPIASRPLRVLLAALLWAPAAVLLLERGGEVRRGRLRAVSGGGAGVSAARSRPRAAGEAPPSAGARGPILRLGDAQRPPFQVLAVELPNAALDGLLLLELDEGEPARATRLAVHDHVHGIDGAVPLEGGANVFFGAREGKVSDIKLLAQTIVPRRIPRHEVRGQHGAPAQTLRTRVAPRNEKGKFDGETEPAGKT